LKRSLHLRRDEIEGVPEILFAAVIAVKKKITLK